MFNDLQLETQVLPLQPNVRNPAQCGFRYWLTPHGCDVRESWPLTKSAEQVVDCEQGSADGCRKQRFLHVGHNQRCGLWVVVCMDHQTVVGYHVMPHGEGRRDAFIPVYRFMPNPPKAMFGDYVCGIEETALNLLPEYFRDVEFYHDIFHGCSHKCSRRFCGRRLRDYASMNTSIMEQV
jgi:hypothetical protein